DEELVMVPPRRVVVPVIVLVEEQYAIADVLGDAEELENTVHQLGSKPGAFHITTYALDPDRPTVRGLGRDRPHELFAIRNRGFCPVRLTRHIEPTRQYLAHNLADG